MSMSAVEPGTRLSERFRLEDRVEEAGGATLWKAIDEVLARPVAVHTFSPDFDRIDEIVTAARAASRLSDPRLTQVFDAADDGETAYVVTEWVTGETLVDLLAGGPLEPERAAGLVSEAAEAMAQAHEAGLAHLMLNPERLVWTGGGTVKLIGLSVDAALASLTSDDPARDDAIGLGMLLYAGLTGHWPGEEDCGLPPAPLDDGRLCSPRQVRAGVPGNLDAIACRAILQESRRGQPALTSPAEVAEALADIPRSVPVPVSGLPPALNPRPDSSAGIDTSPRASQIPLGPRPPTSGGSLNRAMVIVVVVLVMAAVGLGAWSLGRSLGKPDTPLAVPKSETPSVTPKAQTLKPSKAQGFDPLGSDGEEHPELAAAAIDGKPSTDWHTDTYNSPDFGRLKKGVGLLLDMGKSVQIADVVVSLGDTRGASLELKVGDSPDLGALKTVADQNNASGTMTLTPGKAATGQYVLIWFTRLPTSQGKIRGTIYDVVVHSPGSA